MDAAASAPFSEDNGSMRIALISTPRVGNTWIREMLSQSYDLKGNAFHSVEEEKWETFPEKCVLQIHWRRDPDFLEKLRKHGFRTVTISRHPFDVLISILHVTVYGAESEHWLLGKHGDEFGICGAMPTSSPFIEYAMSPRVEALLAVTCDWWKDPECVRTRYEDMVANPLSELTRISQVLGPPARSFEEVIERTSISKMKAMTTANHHWKGQPGLWRQFLPAEEAKKIHAVHRSTFELLEYACDPDPALTTSVADANWIRHAGEELGRKMRQVPGKDNELIELRHAREELQRVVRALEEQRDALEAFAQQHSHESIEAFLRKAAGLHPSSISIACRVDAMRTRSPKLYGLLKWMFGKAIKEPLPDPSPDSRV